MCIDSSSTWEGERKECVRPCWLAVVVCPFLNITSMPEQRNNSHWSLSFLAKYRFIGIWKGVGKTNKHQKLWLWMSQHFHLAWSSRYFCNSSKKTPPKKPSNLGLSLEFICFAETRDFELFKCKFFLKNIVCKAFFFFAFVYLQNRFIF